MMLFLCMRLANCIEQHGYLVVNILDNSGKVVIPNRYIYKIQVRSSPNNQTGSHPMTITTKIFLLPLPLLTLIDAQFDYFPRQVSYHTTNQLAYHIHSKELGEGVIFLFHVCHSLLDIRAFID